MLRRPGAAYALTSDPRPWRAPHAKNKWGPGVRSNSNLASGLKSRPRNCPYTLVARRSGVRVIEGREFLNDKEAGRNASEPRSSLVNLMRLPTSCLNREGRSTDVRAMEATSVSRRGNRDGMYWKLNCPWLPIQNDGGETADCCEIFIPCFSSVAPCVRAQRGARSGARSPCEMGRRPAPSPCVGYLGSS